MNELKLSDEVIDSGYTFVDPFEGKPSQIICKEGNEIAFWHSQQFKRGIIVKEQEDFYYLVREYKDRACLDLGQNPIVYMRVHAEDIVYVKNG